MRTITKVGRKLLCYKIIMIYVFLHHYVVHADNSSQAESILANHNTQTLKIYDQLKSKYINNTDPLLIAQGDQFILYHKGKVTRYPIFSQQYNDLKSVAHVSLATFALFNPLNQFPKNKAQVESYYSLLSDTEKAVDKLPLTAEDKTRQKKILNLTEQFISKSIKKNFCSRVELGAYFQEIAPLIKLNMRIAVKSELEAIHRQMLKIEQQLTKTEIKNLFVIIPVTKAPRQDSLMGQYFSKQLKVPVDSSRLIFAEGLSDTDALLKLAGSWQIEADLSSLYFHNPDAMKRDILGEDTKHQLMKN